MLLFLTFSLFQYYIRLMSVFGRIVKIVPGEEDDDFPRFSLVTLQRNLTYQTREYTFSVRDDFLRKFKINDFISAQYDKDDSLSELLDLQHISVDICTRCGRETEIGDVNQKNPQCCKFFPTPICELMKLLNIFEDDGALQFHLKNKNEELFISNWISDEYFLFQKVKELEVNEHYKITALLENEHVAIENQLTNYAYSLS